MPPMANGELVPKIEDYALIGDLQTAALVSRQGSIDWCCFPRFDSGACFAALVGEPNNGYWRLAPTAQLRRHKRRYRTDTLILESIFETDEGTVRAIDFMPPRDETPDIVRIVEGLEGAVPMRSELVIRFDYGHVVPWVHRVGHARVATAGPDALCLRTPVEIHGEDMMTASEFTLRQGERVPFALTWFPSHQGVPQAVDAEQALNETESYWHDWAAACDHVGDYHDEIHQSLLVLKAMTYAPTGGIVAAPTTSLPEQLGGVRNWDYRFCWIRDAILTLLAMLRAGYEDEATAWSDWLRRAIAGDPGDLQIMYGIAGERRLDERELEWLPGYERSVPVRIGNAASKQLQLDVYGEILDASYQGAVYNEKAGVIRTAENDEGWSVTRLLVERLEDEWRKEDAGIWEMRGSPRHFTYSKVMSWVAFDRAVRICEEFGMPGRLDRWRSLRDEVRAEVLARAWSEDKQAFAQSYGTDELDASVLLMPLLGFLPASDPRILSTVDAIQRELTVDGLVLRYRSREDGAVDGLPSGEGVFLPCSFWLADVLVLQERREEARELFERLLDLRNDVGLLAEEYDPVSGRQLGNFPQAFSHLSLVNTALLLGEDRPMRPDQPRAASVAK
jgi:GH15 family glucan-1,4-alpha-glucosidase